MTSRLSAVLIEGRHEPLGVDTPPRITWHLDPEEGLRPEAFRVVVSSDSDVIADSGDRIGALNSWVLESPLESLRKYTVDVTVRTNRGVAAQRTEFTTGVLHAEDWRGAQWITASQNDSEPAPVVRYTFDAPHGVLDGEDRWLLAVAVAGCAAIRINGVEHVDQLIGGITDFTTRVQYTVLDVSSMITPGATELVIELGNAFYGMTSPNTWNWETAPWHAAPAVKALLVHERDAEVREPERAQYHPTNHTWEAAAGRTTYNDYFGGETFDARRTLEWQPALVVDGPAGQLENARQPPIRETSVIEPTAVTRVGATWVVDFGRVISGWVNLAFRARPGQELVLRYGEKLREDGLPNNDDPVPYFAGRFQEDVYLARGTENLETWHPQFGWKGFRYVSIDGWADEAPTADEITARRIQTAVSRDGEFRSSHPVLNGIHQITVDTMLNNLHGIPTDTPMYEKNGWTGDGMLATEMFLLNFGAAPLLDKWVDDIVDTAGPDGTPSVIAPDGGWTMNWEPCPTWHSALVFIPWSLYMNTGDPRVLERTFPTISAYVHSEFGRSRKGIARTTLGDWLSPEASPGGGNPQEDLRIAATAFLYGQCAIAARIARVVGRSEEAEAFDGLATQVRDAFIEAFFDEQRGYLTSRRDRGFRQSHQALGVGLGLLTGDGSRRAVAALVDDIRARHNHLNTGILATKFLLPVLSDHGHHDVAMDVALQTTYPSWGFWLEHGATTTWEHWDPASRSRNHYALGTVDEWLYTHVLGIRARTAGFERLSLTLRPVPSVTSAAGRVMTPNGAVQVAWSIDETGLVLEATIPTGSIALIDVDPSYLPGEGLPVSTEVGPGTHRLVWTDVHLPAASAPTA